MPSICVCVPVKYLLHEARAQADRVEDLRAAVRLVGRDAHLGHDLEDGLADSLDVALLDLFGRHFLVELGQHLLERLEGEIRVDRLGAIAGQRAELMHLVGFARLDDETDRGAQALLDQVMVHRRRREQRRNGNAVRADGAVGQDDDVVFLRAHGLLGLGAYAVERRRHPRRALLGRIGDVERDRRELVVLHLADLADALQILVGQDRLIHLEPLLPARCLRGRGCSGAGR